MKLETTTLPVYRVGQPFSLDRFRAVEDHEHPAVKPRRGGCWFSPTASAYPQGRKPFGWVEWACDNMPEWVHQKTAHVGRITGRILHITEDTDPYTLPILPRAGYGYGSGSLYYPRYEELLAQGVDAVYLTESGLRRFHMVNGGLELYGWDCVSVLLLNPAAFTSDGRQFTAKASDWAVEFHKVHHHQALQES